MKSGPQPPIESPEEINPEITNPEAEAERKERLATFSRRAILQAGWAVPTVLAIGLPRNVLAQSTPTPPPGPIAPINPEPLPILTVDPFDAHFDDGVPLSDNPNWHYDSSIEDTATFNHSDAVAGRVVNVTYNAGVMSNVTITDLDPFFGPQNYIINDTFDPSPGGAPDYADTYADSPPPPPWEIYLDWHLDAAGGRIEVIHGDGPNYDHVDVPYPTP